MKVAFYTLGCKVNQYDTQMITEKLQAAGYTAVGFEEFADIYVINTCTVTQISDKKSRNTISRARRKNPDAIIVVCGCFSQVFPEEAAGIEGVDIVIGTRNRADILYYINQYLKTGRQIVDVSTVSGIEKENITDFSEKTRAIIKIEDGCRNFCSYCLIPFARGKIISKPVLQITEEARAVAANGYKEIVLTGIHLSSYGVDLDGLSLADAIEAVSQIPGIERIRLGSLEPTVITPDFASRLAAISQLCPSFHLSLQSGCDRTLAAMNRKYTSDQYYRAVTLLREHFLKCAITTDVIVGFPGETDEDFEKSCAFVEKVSFAKVHIFPYSARRGTKAAAMSAQLPKSVKHEREQILVDIEKRCRTEYMSSFTGSEVSVLTEKCEDGVCSGFTDNYLHVRFPGNAQMCNKIITVTVTGVSDNFLTATAN